MGVPVAAAVCGCSEARPGDDLDAAIFSMEPLLKPYNEPGRASAKLHKQVETLKTAFSPHGCIAILPRLLGPIRPSTTSNTRMKVNLDGKIRSEERRVGKE